MKTIIKTLMLLIISTLVVSCNKDNEPELQEYRNTTALSIFVNDGKEGLSTLVSENYSVYTEFWIDGKKSDFEKLTALLPAGNYFRTSINNEYRATTVYRKKSGEVVTYQFPRNYSLYNDDLLTYYKGGERFKMDTTALGAIHSVDASGEQVFAGFFGRQSYSETGAYLQPNKAFYWDGKSKITILPMPTNYFYFTGVSCVYKFGEDVYVAGKMDFPMYWKNKEMVRLNDNYGEVNQITTQGSDVYAVGFYNKRNSNSTGHTACYWINNTLVELEDDAIAYSIFLIGKDVYVAGAKGRFPAEYKACYWKNGKITIMED